MSISFNTNKTKGIWNIGPDCWRRGKPEFPCTISCPDFIEVHSIILHILHNKVNMTILLIIVNGGVNLDLLTYERVDLGKVLSLTGKITKNK